MSAADSTHHSRSQDAQGLHLDHADGERSLPDLGQNARVTERGRGPLHGRTAREPLVAFYTTFWTRPGGRARVIRVMMGGGGASHG